MNFSWNERRLLIVCASFVFMASSLLAVWIGYPRGIGTDGALYALSGYNLFHGHGFTYSDVPNTFLSPLFSILIGLLSLFVSDLQVCAHIVLTVALMVSIFPFYFFVKRLFGESAARVAIVVYSINGFLLRMSVRMTPEILLIALLITAFYYSAGILQSIRNKESLRITDFIGCGIFLGLSYLTKPEAFQFFIIVFMFLFVFLWQMAMLKKNAVSLMTLGVSFLVVVFPQIYFIHEMTGKWQLTTYSRFFFRGYVEPLVSLSPGDAPANPKIEYNYNAYYIHGPYSEEEKSLNSERFPNHMVNYAKCMLTVIGPLGLLFLIVSFLSGRPLLSERVFLYLLLIPMLTLIFWYRTADKFFVMFIPIFITLATYTISIWKNSEFQKMRRLAFAAIVLVMLQSFMPMLDGAPTNAVSEANRRMGAWICKNMPELEGQLIADRKPYVCYFAKAKYYRYNNVRDIPYLLEQLRSDQVNYLIVEDLITNLRNPGVAELLNGPTSDLELVHSIGEDEKIILYRIKR